MEEESYRGEPSIYASVALYFDASQHSTNMKIYYASFVPYNTWSALNCVAVDDGFI